MNYSEKWANRAPAIQNCIENNTGRDLQYIASIMAVATNIPVLECCYILVEKFGSTPELESNIANLKVFYNK